MFPAGDHLAVPDFEDDAAVRVEAPAVALAAISPELREDRVAAFRRRRPLTTLLPSPLPGRDPDIARRFGQSEEDAVAADRKAGDAQPGPDV